MHLRGTRRHALPRSGLAPALGPALLAACLLILAGHTPDAYAAQPGPEDEDARVGEAAPYLWKLLDEINRRRDELNTPRLALALDGPGAALALYLGDLAGSMTEAHDCFHGVGRPPRYGWDAVAETGFAAEARDEVIACPAPDGYWTSERVADAWWDSPSHRTALFGDPATNLIVCGAHHPSDGGAAYQLVICVTYRS